MDLTFCLVVYVLVSYMGLKGECAGVFGCLYNRLVKLENLLVCE